MSLEIFMGRVVGEYHVPVEHNMNGTRGDTRGAQILMVMSSQGNME